MKLLTASTKAAAQALAGKAYSYATNQQGASGEKWSPVYTFGGVYGIAYDSSVLSGFTAAELGAVTVGEGMTASTTYSKIIDAEMKQTDQEGVVTGDWEVAP